MEKNRTTEDRPNRDTGIREYSCPAIYDLMNGAHGPRLWYEAITPRKRIIDGTDIIYEPYGYLDCIDELGNNAPLPYLKADTYRHYSSTHSLKKIEEGEYYRYECNGRNCPWISCQYDDPKKNHPRETKWIKKAPRETESPPRSRAVRSRSPTRETHH